VIGLIDGYFQEVPAVWHKEILWAMAQGIHVFGAASMGALRGAELASFGMRGVGRIFEAYRDGRLPPYETEAFEDDDEVAVIHGPADSGFVALSEAMVNIRCTLASAAAAGIIRASTRDALVGIGKRLFFPDRSYERLLAVGVERGLPATELDGFRAWLPAGRVNQKRDDALAMLGAVRDLLAGDPAPARVEYVFQSSEMWQRAAMFSAPARPGSAGDAPGLPLEALLDEVRLDGLAYAKARREALLRLLALREYERRRLALGDPGRRQAIGVVRRRLGMFGPEAVERWLAENDLTPADGARLLDDEARLDHLDTLAAAAVDAGLVDQLRATGDYGRYAARARAKRRALAGADLDGPSADEATRFLSTTWYFEEHLGVPVPEDVTAYAIGVGFPDLAAFYRAILRERVYASREERIAEPDPDGDRSRRAGSGS
jgi:hypothetical protein